MLLYFPKAAAAGHYWDSSSRKPWLPRSVPSDASSDVRDNSLSCLLLADLWIQGFRDEEDPVLAFEGSLPNSSVEGTVMK